MDPLATLSHKQHRPISNDRANFQASSHETATCLLKLSKKHAGGGGETTVGMAFSAHLPVRAASRPVIATSTGVGPGLAARHENLQAHKPLHLAQGSERNSRGSGPQEKPRQTGTTHHPCGPPGLPFGQPASRRRSAWVGTLHTATKSKTGCETWAKTTRRIGARRCYCRTRLALFDVAFSCLFFSFFFLGGGALKQ